MGEILSGITLKMRRKDRLVFSWKSAWGQHEVEWYSTGIQHAFNTHSTDNQQTINRQSTGKHRLPIAVETAEKNGKCRQRSCCRRLPWT
ncbi:MAG: hypothetical protein ACRYGK_17210 [Janthinobacterium lividum]